MTLKQWAGHVTFFVCHMTLEQWPGHVTFFVCHMTMVTIDCQKWAPITETKSLNAKYI